MSTQRTQQFATHPPQSDTCMNAAGASQFAPAELAQHECDPLWSGFAVERRDFFKLLGCGVVVCFALGAAAQESGHAGRRSMEEQIPHDVDSWLHIGEAGGVTVFTGKAEMGQNIRTSLAQQVAEELSVPLASVALVMADTALTPFDMGTFGSRTTPYMGRQLREVASRARELLIAMAAERWGIDRAGLEAADAHIVNPATHQSLSYAELARGKRRLETVSALRRAGSGGAEPASACPASAAPQPGAAGAAESALKLPTAWQVAGKAEPKVEGRAFVTGAHHYTSDLARPGMVRGKVLRPPAYHATLESLDSRQAEAIPGVTVVRDGDFVGVTASDVVTAERALAQLKAQWRSTPQISDRELYPHLRQTAQAGDEDHQRASGSVTAARAQAKHTLSHTYTVAYIQHAPLEPRAALAEWADGRLTVWTGTQRPFGVREELSRAFHLPLDSVRVIVPDTGAAYGGKHMGDAAIEAARLAKACGHPVKLLWTREEEFTWAYFRPAGVIDVAAGCDSAGKLLFWECDNYNSGPSAIDTPYAVANRRIEFHPSDEPLRQGSYRGLAATANHFARESHMDELAHAAGVDPLEFRLRNLEDERLRAVFQAAAEKFGWGHEPSSAARGYGLAGGIEKGGRVATCAEVAIDRGARRIHITRVVEAFECGAIVNPEGLRNQISGAIVQGIGGAMFEAVRFENGRVTNPHFAQYRVPRFADAPQIEVVLVDRRNQPPAGAGETPIVGIAPAVANAIFAATGLRLRAMPLVPDGLPASASNE